MIPVRGTLDSKTGAVRLFTTTGRKRACGFCGKHVPNRPQYQIVKDRVRYLVHNKCRERFEAQ